MQEKRWKVLIVDDEYRIGILVKKLIRWDELSMECMDVVDNGETALEIIRTKEPDIVITDIRMPKVNGLDMISMAKQSREEVKFVVVSGYKEFEYAHRALQYGVDDYILKPINAEELNKVLKKIYNELFIREEQHETFSESRHIIKRDFLKNIIEQETEMGEKDTRVPMDGEIYRGIDIKLDYTDYNKSDKKQDKLTFDKIVATVERILKTSVEEVLICEKENLHIYCLFNYDYSKSKIIKGSINDILSELKEQLIGFEQYEITIGVGTERREFGEIRFSIKEAYRAVGNRIKLGTGRLIYAENIPQPNKESLKNLVERYGENILTSIETYAKERLESCINHIYSDFMLKEDMDFSQCYEIAEEIIRIFLMNIEIEQDEMRRMKRRIWNNCQHCYSIYTTKDFAEK
ncbi:response regulator [Lachnospiraceae bacterium 42-17]|nr:response regulator [Dorea sp.]